MDFTVTIYRQLLKSLQQASYRFITFDDFLKSDHSEDRVIILRHDVDLLPQNSLKFAEIQAEAGIKGTYYFRAVPQSWDENVIKKIADLGHEIGYHYECLTTCKGDFVKAMADFDRNLKALRELAPVSTICMHGSPMSKYDSKDLWKDYSYQGFDIIGEPYFDIDFQKTFYLTDTGRRWNGDKVSVRDKVDTSFKSNYKKTQELIDSISQNQLPDQIMFTFHPQRWNDNLLIWTKELVLQNTKNIIKQMLFVR